ncbi:MAG: pyrrolo-quinoline quinone [Geminicoccaceae bacterium]|nr:MAG: pyrrolo-quinoline quinone [Geminicoccaceae bacterium]
MRACGCGARLRVGVLGLPLLLGACGFGWWGEADAPPLPGERQPVLLLEAGPEPDPALAGAPVVLPPVRNNDAWPQIGGDATHTLLHVALEPPLRRAWTADVGRGNSATSRLIGAPVVDGGLVFAADANATVAAFRLENGQRVWRRSFRLGTDRRLGAGLAAQGGGVFVATSAGEVAGLDAANGEIIWSTELGSPVRAAPTLVGRTVLVTTADNQTFALDAVTGATLWAHQAFAEVSAILGGASPASAGGAVIAPYSSGEVFGLVLENGAPVWIDSVRRPVRTAAIAAISDIRAAPVIDPAGRVIVAGHGGEVAAIDIPSGQRLWDQRLTSAETPWVTTDSVFLVTTQGEVVALDSETGRIRWVTQLQRFRRGDDPDSGRITYTGPVLASGRLWVIGSNGELTALAPATGAVIDTTPIATGVTLAPAIARGTLIVLDDRGRLHAYR